MTSYVFCAPGRPIPKGGPTRDELSYNVQRDKWRACVPYPPPLGGGGGG